MKNKQSCWRIARKKIVVDAAVKKDLAESRFEEKVGFGWHSKGPT